MKPSLSAWITSSAMVSQSVQFDCGLVHTATQHRRARLSRENVTGAKIRTRHCDMICQQGAQRRTAATVEAGRSGEAIAAS